MTLRTSIAAWRTVHPRAHTEHVRVAATAGSGVGLGLKEGGYGEIRTVSWSYRKMRMGLANKLQSCVEKARASTGADRFSEDECVVGGKRSVWGDTLGARLSARFEEGWHQLWGSANIGLKGISI